MSDFGTSVELVIDGSESEMSTFSFKCSFNGAHLFTFKPEYKIHDWGLLIEACETNTSYCLDWTPLNGFCKITVNGSTTTFKIAKYDNSNGVKLSVTVPTTSCLPAFIKASELSA
jgi:hypothetical protein